MSAGKQAFQMLTHRKKKRRGRGSSAVVTHTNTQLAGCVTTGCPEFNPPPRSTLNALSRPWIFLLVVMQKYKHPFTRPAYHRWACISPTSLLLLSLSLSAAAPAWKTNPVYDFRGPPMKSQRGLFFCNKTIKGFRRNNEFMYNKWPLFLGPPPPSFFSHLQASRALWPECALILLCMSWNHCAPKWQEGYSKNEINITVQNPPMNKTSWALKSPTRVGHVLLISLRCKSRWSVGE